MPDSHAVVHVLLERFRQASRGREFDALLSMGESLDRILARYGSGWTRPSFDEAFLASDARRKALTTVDGAERLRGELSRELGLDCSIGIASTRFAARICSRLARPRGILVWAPGRERSLLSGMPLEELDELRPEQLARLRLEGICTLDEMACLGAKEARAVLGFEGEKLISLLRGGDPIFGETPGSGLDRLKKSIGLLARRLAGKLDRGARRARGLELAIAYADGVSRSRYTLLPRATSSTEELQEAASRLLSMVPGRPEPVIGLSLAATGLTGQIDLFPQAPPREVRVTTGRIEIVFDTTREQSICSRHTLGGRYL